MKKILLALFLVGCSDGNFNVAYSNDLTDTSPNDAEVVKDTSVETNVPDTSVIDSTIESDTYVADTEVVKDTSVVDSGCNPLKCSSNNCDIMPDGCGGTVDCGNSCDRTMVCGGYTDYTIMPDFSFKKTNGSPNVCGGVCKYEPTGSYVNSSTIGYCNSTYKYFLLCSNLLPLNTATLTDCTKSSSTTTSRFPGVSSYCCKGQTLL